MNKEHFKAAIEASDKGKVQFTSQYLIAFSFGGSWYPLRAVINQALQIANSKKENTSTCRIKLKSLGLFYEEKTVPFKKSKPTPLSYDDKIEHAIKSAQKRK